MSGKRGAGPTVVTTLGHPLNDILCVSFLCFILFTSRAFANLDGAWAISLPFWAGTLHHLGY